MRNNMICPNCLKKVSQEVITCPNCDFDLSNAFIEFDKREKKIHNKVRQLRIIHDKKIYYERIQLTDFLFELTSKKPFKDRLDDCNISNEEWNCLQFKLISKVYLAEITKKAQIRTHLDNILESYDGEYMFRIDVLSKNLTNLINLVGINPFSKYYFHQLNDYKLSIVEGLEVLGRVIEDLLYGRIFLEDLDAKIKSFMNQAVNEPERVEYEDGLNKAIRKYFELTGRDYFSQFFENKLLKHEFTIQDAYNIKFLFLKRIIMSNSRKNLKVKLDEIILSYFSHSNSKSVLEEKSIHLVGDTYSYYDSISIGNDFRSKRKRKKHRKNKGSFIEIKSEELGSDDGSYDDQLDFEREILGDY